MNETIDWGSMALLEEMNAPQWYTLPEGWTWRRVAENRNGMPTRFFPLACAPGVVAWGRPLPH
jgi:hypothetical protein